MGSTPKRALFASVMMAAPLAALLPFLSRTAWFYVLCMVGLVVLAGSLLHWLRIRRLKEEVLKQKVEARTQSLLEEKRKTEAQALQLKEQAERLRGLDEAKRRLLASVSHEFRTPLALILGPLRDLLEGRRGTIDDEARRQLEVASRNARRVEQLIDQLLDLSQLEAGQMELHPGRGELVGFVQGIVRSLMPLAERRRIALQYCAAVRRLEATFDAEKLRRVVENLISNALECTPEQGTVVVTVAEAGEQVVLSVRDTGAGIPEEELPYVFDRYRRVNGSAMRALKGAGFGLSLTKELTELHGGTVRVESEAGAGAEFAVTLPRHAANGEKSSGAGGAASLSYREETGRRPQAVPEERAEASAEPPEDPPTILVVEDHPDVRAFLRIRLRTDYRVEEARDGAEALEKVRVCRPALVLSDIMMPRMDGAELCRTLKADDRLSDVPVILLTAKAGEAERVKGLHTGADDYVEKPFSMAELRARIGNLIESRRALRQRFSREVVMRPLDITITSEDEAFYESARAVVEAHMAQTDFDVSAFAAAMNVSKSTLNRRLKAATGLTPAYFVRELRLQRAAQLLEQEAKTVAQAAYAVGYSNTDHFSKIFRQHFGAPPSAYPADDA